MPSPVFGVHGLDLDVHEVIVADLYSGYVAAVNIDLAWGWRVVGESVGAGKLTLKTEREKCFHFISGNYL